MKAGDEESLAFFLARHGLSTRIRRLVPLGQGRQRTTNSPEFVGFTAREFVEFQTMTRSIRVFHRSLHAELVFGVRQDESDYDSLPRFYLAGNVDRNTALAQIEDLTLDGGCAAEHLHVTFDFKAGMPPLCVLSDSRTFIE